MNGLARQIERVFHLLKKVEPHPNEYDVVWAGPYYIPRPRQWCPSRFTLFRGTLYASLFIAPAWHGLSWKVGSDEVAFERGLSSGDHRLDESQWAEALAQIERRLESALKGFEAYNRRVERLLPPTCRTGTIQRRLTWPRAAKPPLAAREAKQLTEAINARAGSPPPEEVTLSMYLETVAVAYDAVFKDLRALPPVEKYLRRADGRHGGLLDLPPHDAGDFSEWFHVHKWSGTHPWEIVFGHPHGIMISPRPATEARGWRFSLWVSSEGWYAAAARMAGALALRRIPLEFHDCKKVADALRGVDEVEVGPDPYAVSYQEIEETRPDALRSIRWDPVAQLGPITPEQMSRVEAAELQPDS